MRTLLIGAAAAAAIGFTSLTMGTAHAAPACSVQAPSFYTLPASVQSQIVGGCLASARAAGVPAEPPPGVVPVLPPQGAPDPQCAQYHVPGDIQRCEDELHGAHQ